MFCTNCGSPLSAGAPPSSGAPPMYPAPGAYGGAMPGRPGGRVRERVQYPPDRGGYRSGGWRHCIRPVHVRPAEAIRENAAMGRVRGQPRYLDCDFRHNRAARLERGQPGHIRGDVQPRAHQCAPSPGERLGLSECDPGPPVRRGDLSGVVPRQPRGDSATYDSAGDAHVDDAAAVRPVSSPLSRHRDWSDRQATARPFHFFFEITWVTKNFWPSWFSASALWSWFIQRILMHRSRSWTSVSPTSTCRRFRIPSARKSSPHWARRVEPNGCSAVRTVVRPSSLI